MMLQYAQLWRACANPDMLSCVVLDQQDTSCNVFRAHHCAGSPLAPIPTLEAQLQSRRTSRQQHGSKPVTVHMPRYAWTGFCRPYCTDTAWSDDHAPPPSPPTTTIMCGTVTVCTHHLCMEPGVRVEAGEHSFRSCQACLNE